MNGKPAKGTIRVTVMLGNNLTDRETLAVLELLQPESPAEVQGLYIEDTELLSLADVPVVREYCRLTQAGRRLQVEDLERQFRTQARMAERALAETLNPRGFPWSFRSLRGDPVALLRQMLAEVDLMLIGATAGMSPAAGRGRGAASRRAVMAVFDQAEPAGRALHVAMQLADAGGTDLVIVLAAAQHEDIPALHQRAAALAGDRPVEFQEIIRENTAGLLKQLRKFPAVQLVLGIPASELDSETITLLRSRSTCPVILVK
jgi:hypothetical protein